MKNLCDVDKENLVQRLDAAVKKRSKMVLSNCASNEATKVNKSSMKSWIKSSPFFLKKEKDDENKNGEV